MSAGYGAGLFGVSANEELAVRNQGEGLDYVRKNQPKKAEVKMISSQQWEEMVLAALLRFKLPDTQEARSLIEAGMGGYMLN